MLARIPPRTVAGLSVRRWSPREAALDDTDPQNRLAAAVRCSGSARPAAVPTIALTATNTGDNFLRPQARYYMRRYGKNADLIAGVVPLVRAEDQGRRRAALDLLLEIAPPATVTAALRAALDADDPEVRRWAAGKLESLKPGPEKSSKGGETPEEEEAGPGAAR